MGNLLARLLAMGAALAALTITCASATRYQIIDLGTLGGPTSSAQAVNDSGQIVGVSDALDRQPHAFLWQDGQMVAIGGIYTSAYDINNRGQVVGWQGSCPVDLAFFWQNGVMSEVGEGASVACGIDDSGQIAGYTPRSGSVYSHACLWTNGVVHFLVDGGDSSWSSACAISNNGQVAGQCGPTAAYWHDDVMVDLGNLAGMTYSEAWGINDNEQIVGRAYDLQGHQQAFLWQGGKMTPIDFAGFNGSLAAGINNRGQIVGISNGRAFLWQDGTMTLLDGLSAGYSEAWGINSTGWIVGASDAGDRRGHAVLWRPLISVTIDIKPGDDHNSINLKAKGIVRVAVLGSSVFDVRIVDPSTVRFAEAPPLRWSLEDVDKDGNMDLILRFDVGELALTSSSTSATLSGMTTSGEAMEGSDTIRIVPPR
jgi:probable HAF family extracellular repeat protein